VKAYCNGFRTFSERFQNVFREYLKGIQEAAEPRLHKADPYFYICLRDAVSEFRIIRILTYNAGLSSGYFPEGDYFRNRNCSRSKGRNIIGPIIIAILIFDT
jgi:hypothetical protein